MTRFVDAAEHAADEVLERLEVVVGPGACDPLIDVEAREFVERRRPEALKVPWQPWADGGADRSEVRRVLARGAQPVRR